MAPTTDGATVGSAAWLWHMADERRERLDAAEETPIRLEPLLLTDSSDAFEATAICCPPFAACWAPGRRHPHPEGRQGGNASKRRCPNAHPYSLSRRSCHGPPG